VVLRLLRCRRNEHRLSRLRLSEHRRRHVEGRSTIRSGPVECTPPASAPPPISGEACRAIRTLGPGLKLEFTSLVSGPRGREPSVAGPEINCAVEAIQEVRIRVQAIRRNCQIWLCQLTIRQAAAHRAQTCMLFRQSQMAVDCRLSDHNHLFASSGAGPVVVRPPPPIHMSQRLNGEYLKLWPFVRIEGPHCARQSERCPIKRIGIRHHHGYGFAGNRHVRRLPFVGVYSAAQFGFGAGQGECRAQVPSSRDLGDTGPTMRANVINEYRMIRRTWRDKCEPKIPFLLRRGDIR